MDDLAHLAAALPPVPKRLDLCVELRDLGCRQSQWLHLLSEPDANSASHFAERWAISTLCSGPLRPLARV